MSSTPLTTSIPPSINRKPGSMPVCGRAAGTWTPFTWGPELTGTTAAELESDGFDRELPDTEGELSELEDSSLDDTCELLVSCELVVREVDELETEDDSELLLTELEDSSELLLTELEDTSELLLETCELELEDCPVGPQVWESTISIAGSWVAVESPTASTSVPGSDVNTYQPLPRWTTCPVSTEPPPLNATCTLAMSGSEPLSAE